MPELTINKSERKSFEKIFKFLNSHNCKVLMSGEGLLWKNEVANGLIYKTAFQDYPFENNRKIGIIQQDKKIFANWVKKWEDTDNLTTINLN